MKQKRIVAICLGIVLCAMSLVGCKKSVGTPEDNPVAKEAAQEELMTYTYGFSVINMNNPYYTTLRESIQEEVARDGGSMIVKDPGDNAGLQMAQIREMMEEGMDFLFLSPVDWEKISPVLDELEEAEIEVLNIDTRIKETEKVSAYIGTDNRSAGYLCGEDLADHFEDGGKVAILECTRINSISDRIMGFEEAIAEKGFEVTERKDITSTKEQAKIATTELLRANEELTAIMCGNDQMALGALEALKEANRSDVLLYSVDGSPQLKKEMEKSGSQVAGIAGQSPINLGKAAARTAVNILTGEKYEPETLVETYLITKDNLDMYGVDGWQ